MYVFIALGLHCYTDGHYSEYNNVSDVRPRNSTSESYRYIQAAELYYQKYTIILQISRFIKLRRIPRDSPDPDWKFSATVVRRQSYQIQPVSVASIQRYTTSSLSLSPSVLQTNNKRIHLPTFFRTKYFSNSYHR